MTKKILTILLAFAMLAATACSQDSTSEPTKNSISVSDSSQVNPESENSSESDTGSSSDSESENSTDDNSVVTSKTTSTTSDATVTKNSNTPKATTTTKTSESDAGTTTTPAITTTDASITRIATEITVPQTATSKAATTTRTTTKATAKATTQATQKPVVTTTTKATTKPVTTTTKTTTAKPSSDKVIYQKVYQNPNNEMYYYVTETQSRHAICEKGIASMAAEINKIRKANGLNTLKVNPLLTKAAMIRARELAETYVKYGGISHTRPNGKQASSVIWEVGYDGNAFENAYYAFDWIDWKECLRVWLNSPDHKRNILDKGHEVMGLAIINVTVRNEYMRTGSQRTFAIQLFD